METPQRRRSRSKSPCGTLRLFRPLVQPSLPTGSRIFVLSFSFYPLRAERLNTPRAWQSSELPTDSTHHSLRIIVLSARLIMKFLSDLVPLVILAAATASSFPITRRDVNEALIPQFGFSSGVNPTGASLPIFEPLSVD